MKTANNKLSFSIFFIRIYNILCEKNEFYRVIYK